MGAGRNRIRSNFQMGEFAGTRDTYAKLHVDTMWPSSAEYLQVSQISESPGGGYAPIANTIPTMWLSSRTCATSFPRFATEHGHGSLLWTIDRTLPQAAKMAN